MPVDILSGSHGCEALSPFPLTSGLNVYPELG